MSHLNLRLHLGHLIGASYQSGAVDFLVGKQNGVDPLIFAHQFEGVFVDAEAFRCLQIAVVTYFDILRQFALEQVNFNALQIDPLLADTLAVLDFGVEERVGRAEFYVVKVVWVEQDALIFQGGKRLAPG